MVLSSIFYKSFFYQIYATQLHFWCSECTSHDLLQTLLLNWFSVNTIEDLNFSFRIETYSNVYNKRAVMPQPGGPGRPLAPPPQYLADQLTLFQPGEGRLSPPITTRPPKKFHLPASLLPMNSPLHSIVFSFAKPIKTSIILKSVNSYPKQ